ncbi:MAG: P-II family nitrogen regulator [Clostridia bacterium]|nr:P-II family nitrogen regulator [Clostridia bacterium]
MKEVMAVIRMNMINQTKQALLADGFPALNCRKVIGRGRKKVDFSLIQNMITGMQSAPPVVAETITEEHRLIPKRLLSLVVKDDEVKKAVDTIIRVNSKGNPGDGKIFVMPVSETVRIRTGEMGEDAV